MTMQGGTTARWIRRTLLTVLFVSAWTGLAGCEKRVVRQKSYYSGQFSHVTDAKAPTAAPAVLNEKETNIFSDMWNGLTDLFEPKKKPAESRNVMSVEELRQMQQKRAAEGESKR